MATELGPTNVITGLDYPCRASYVNVFKSRVNDLSGDSEFSMQILIPKKDKATVKLIKEAMKVAAADKFKDKIPKKMWNPLRDGDKEGVGGVPEDVEPGSEPYGKHYFMNIKNKRKPQVVDQNKQHVIDPDSFVSGDYCRVHINAFGFDTKGNKGVSFGLNSIQIVKKGEPLDGRVAAEKVFDEIEEAEDMEGEEDPFVD